MKNELLLLVPDYIYEHVPLSSTGRFSSSHHDFEKPCSP